MAQLDRLHQRLYEVLPKHLHQLADTIIGNMRGPSGVYFGEKEGTLTIRTGSSKYVQPLIGSICRYPFLLTGERTGSPGDQNLLPILRTLARYWEAEYAMREVEGSDGYKIIEYSRPGHITRKAYVFKGIDGKSYLLYDQKPSLLAVRFYDPIERLDVAIRCGCTIGPAYPELSSSGKGLIPVYRKGGLVFANPDVGYHHDDAEVWVHDRWVGLDDADYSYYQGCHILYSDSVETCDGELIDSRFAYPEDDHFELDEDLWGDFREGIQWPI